MPVKAQIDQPTSCSLRMRCKNSPTIATPLTSPSKQCKSRLKSHSRPLKRFLSNGHFILVLDICQKPHINK
ncbi:conserved hypothetical protein [Trichinella spiralis]|uniref:hypothetical protein n=1 Tax=Trichinella spiralis TaxID=6334 RepID=UPI0001EFB4DA|nr:conserved hypothetical protein [Trichinella spiralis]